MSLALSTALWAESPEKKGLDVINRSTAEAHIGFLADDDLEGRDGRFPWRPYSGRLYRGEPEIIGYRPCRRLLLPSV